MTSRKQISISLAAVFFSLAGIYIYAAYDDWLGQSRGAGEITGEARSDVLVAAREAEMAAITAGLNKSPEKQILFGDLHVHTTFSTDAFLWSLPIYGGEARIH